MNYQKVYDQIIQRSKSRGLDKKKLEGYFEKHHIIPRCMKGLDDKSNLILLTGREHYICHRLLCKISTNNKLRLSLFRMIHGQQKCNRNWAKTGFAGK